MIATENRPGVASGGGGAGHEGSSTQFGDVIELT